MSIAIRQITPVFAGEVSGVDITQPLGADDVAAIEAGMDRYAVLVFHDQRLTDEQQMAFSRNFGELEHTAGGNITKAAGAPARPVRWPTCPTSTRTTSRWRATTAGGMFNLGNRLWHSDSSFRAVAGEVFAAVGPHRGATQGGNTEFADMRAAYDALDAATKAEIEDLVCEHSLIYSRGTLGFTELTERGAGDDRAGAPAPGAHASGDGPEIAVPVVAYRHASSAGRCRRRAPSSAT